MKITWCPARRAIASNQEAREGTHNLARGKAISGRGSALYAAALSHPGGGAGSSLLAGPTGSKGSLTLDSLFPTLSAATFPAATFSAAALSAAALSAAAFATAALSAAALSHLCGSARANARCQRCAMPRLSVAIEVVRCDQLAATNGNPPHLIALSGRFVFTSCAPRIVVVLRCCCVAPGMPGRKQGRHV